MPSLQANCQLHPALPQALARSSSCRHELYSPEHTKQEQNGTAGATARSDACGPFPGAEALPVPAPAEGCAAAGPAHACLLGHRPPLLCLFSFIQLHSTTIPWAGDYFIAEIFSFSIVVIIEGRAFITSLRWKEMIKTKGERQENTIEEINAKL